MERQARLVGRVTEKGEAVARGRRWWQRGREGRGQKEDCEGEGGGGGGGETQEM